MAEATTTTAISAAEWRAKATQLGNGNILDCRLQCLSCGTIFTPRQFEAAGGNPRSAPQQCIGRAALNPDKPLAKLTGRKRAASKVDGNTKPCNWATFGMIELPGLTRVRQVDGAELLVWPFADEYQPHA